MSIKMIAFDLDETTYTKGKMSKNVKDTLKKLEEKGYILLPITGRTLRSVKNILKGLNIGYVVTTTGAIIQKFDDGSIIYNNCLSQEDYEYIKTFKTSEVNLSVYTKDKIYYESMVKELFADVSTLKEPLFKIKNNTQFKDIVRINFMADEKIIDEFEKNLKCSNYYTVRNLSECLEVLNKNASKGNALEYMMKLYGLSKDEVLAIGDGNNDLTMAKKVEHFVAMGNAKEELKKKARYITKTVDEDGFCYIINKLNLL